MKNITSLKNPAVQDARALATAKERSRQRAFLLDGEHMVGEGLHNCPERVKTVFVDEKRAEGFRLTYMHILIASMDAETKKNIIKSTYSNNCQISSPKPHESAAFLLHKILYSCNFMKIHLLCENVW